MKKGIIYAAIAIAFVSLSAFSVQQSLKKSYAEVNQQKGVYIFVDSKPLNDFEFLGEVQNKRPWGGSSQYTEVKNDLVDRCVKEYPKADGVILHFITGQRDRAEAIRFR